YLESLSEVEGIEWSGSWSAETTARVASGLLRIATDFGLLRGTQAREFASYHLPDESLLYLLHSMKEVESSPRKLVDSTDWHMFLMNAEDVERELLRLHQFHKLHYDVAGSIVHLRMQHASLDEYVEELCA
ncbi:MAG: BrxA family protein, partial [Coriobacteriia bacterium]|nr:BrxA family protein [Coriobacteriia bacterium]